MHNNSNIRNKQMVINSCKIYPFSKFRGFMPAKWPFFLVSWIRPSHWKNTPFFAKMGTSVVYVLVGSRGAGIIHVLQLVKTVSALVSKLAWWTHYNAVTGASWSPATGWFPHKRASNAKSLSMWWRHHRLHVWCLPLRSWPLRNCRAQPGGQPCDVTYLHDVHDESQPVGEITIEMCCLI